MQLVLSELPIILCGLGGLALIILEAFLPGFGLPGLSGICLEIAAVVFAYMYHGPVVALCVLLLILSIVAIVLSLVLRSAAKGKLSKSRMILRNTESSDAGYTASDDTGVFLGKTGQTTTPLRPTGIADFDGVRLNVMSDGDFIESGVSVRITSAEGSRIVVKPV
ncbi:MAG: hypothetical protein IJ083_14620 [Clostridia bacterium]|nr:hypothetical protein [Clostridia bacterium]